jgi:hypothetical protein
MPCPALPEVAGFQVFLCGRIWVFANNKVMAVAIETEPEFTAATPKALFEGRHYTPSHGHDIDPDGERFVMIKEIGQESSPTQINVVTNWFEELKRLTAEAQ